MNKIVINAVVIISVAFAACNNAKKPEAHDMSNMSKDSSSQKAVQSGDEFATITPKYSNVDSKIAGDIKDMVNHYLHVKNALANDNSNEAANGSKAMSAVLAKVDKSYLTADQKKVYDESESDLKEHAEHISNSKLDHQREHFSQMSEDMYSLVRAFGAGQTLYHDHCPMYNDNKGAMWLSEEKEIKNPYMGSQMPKCGKVKEKIQ